MGFRSYVDTQMAGALKVARLIAKISDSDSEDELEAPAPEAKATSLRENPRKFPREYPSLTGD